MNTLIDYVNAEGLIYYDWNALNNDAVCGSYTPEQLVDNIMNDALQHDDVVILMHDLESRHTTVESLPMLIERLRDDGYELLPIYAMTYEEARSYIEYTDTMGSVLGLDSIKELLRRLGDPQDAVPVIHIAGTNGKGSICAFLDEILESAGYSVGRYISPTIFTFCRIS